MIRTANVNDVPALRDLIASHAELGRMLFRSPAQLYDSLRDFQVCDVDGEIIGCCALQIIWADLAEIRSLAVRQDSQGKGIGRDLVAASLAEAGRLSIGRVFTLTLEADFFGKLGFGQVPMDSLPQKVWSDCVSCSKKLNCDEIAMLIDVN